MKKENQILKKCGERKKEIDLLQKNEAELKALEDEAKLINETEILVQKQQKESEVGKVEKISETRADEEK